MAPALAITHLAIGIILLATVATILLVALPAVLRGHPPPPLYRPLQRVTAVVVVAQAVLGGLLLLSKRQPRAEIHFVYAAAALLVMPIAYALARRDPGRSRYYHVGGTVLLLGVLFRLVTTG